MGSGIRWFDPRSASFCVFGSEFTGRWSGMLNWRRILPFLKGKVMQRRYLMGVLLTVMLAGCGATTTVTVSATPPSTAASSGNSAHSAQSSAVQTRPPSATQITLSGERSGQLVLTGGPAGTSCSAGVITVEGTADGYLFDLSLSPSRATTSGDKVEVAQRTGTDTNPGNGPAGSWSTTDLSGVTNLDVAKGATLNLDLSPSGGGATSTLHLSGVIVC